MRSRGRLPGIAPRSGRLWITGAVALAAIAVATYVVRGFGGTPPLELLALGPDGLFRDHVLIPPEWADAGSATPDAVARFPLILGVRNPGHRPATPERLSIGVPDHYRLSATDGRDLAARVEPGAPLTTYLLRPGFEALEPGRLPDLIPAHDTLWLEVVVPAYFCVAAGDSIPEFVAADPPPLGPLAEVRLFYSFDGGDLPERRTGTLVIGLDTATLVRPRPVQVPAYPTVVDTGLAAPRLGELRRLGERRIECGEPDSPMELVGTVWETAGGGRFITLEYAGRIRKHLYDLDGDGLIERESWSPDGEAFTATRQARLPVPAGLALGTAPAVDTGEPRPAATAPAAPRRISAPDTALSLEDLPVPQIRPAGGRLIEGEPVPPDSGG